MRTALAIMFSSLLTVPASAGTIAFDLSLHIPVSCSVNEVKITRLDTGLVTVDANCNAPVFNLLMGGELGRMSVRSVSVEHASASVRNNQINVRTQRPGRYIFLLDYRQSLSHIQSAPVQIQTL